MYISPNPINRNQTVTQTRWTMPEATSAKNMARITEKKRTRINSDKNRKFLKCFTFYLLQGVSVQYSRLYQYFTTNFDLRYLLTHIVHYTTHQNGKYTHKLHKNQRQFFQKKVKVKHFWQFFKFCYKVFFMSSWTSAGNCARISAHKN